MLHQILLFFFNRLKASEGRAEHTSARKISRAGIYCLLKGSHPRHTMAEVFRPHFTDGDAETQRS